MRDAVRRTRAVSDRRASNASPGLLKREVSLNAGYPTQASGRLRVTASLIALDVRVAA
jgi:hypothetical protein